MPVHTQTPGFCHRAARCLALLLLSTVEVGLSYRSEPAIDKLNSTLSPAHQHDEAASKTGPDSASTDRLGRAIETQAVVPHTANGAEEAQPRGRLVPTSALVAIGRTSIFRSSVGKLISSLAQALRTAVDVGAATLGHASNQLSTASGIMLLAGTRVQSNLISFIGWGGVAAGGWNAVNAAEGIASQPGACKKVVQGAKLVVSLGATGLSVASMLCVAGAGGTVAGFGAAAVDNLWMVLEPALDGWCNSGKEDDDVEVAFEAKNGLNSEDDAKRLMKEMITVRDGGCGNERDILLTPEAADEKYRPHNYGFAERMQHDMDDMAHCTKDLFAHRVGVVPSAMDWYCASSWS
mmetsp:Transcript_85723/g.265370  ORF Transcript_85723/g.265370 Transcript_85723/m.265370 type:complete len:350 (-) Transcript_85723:8-1057(-)